ncbi:hypothetical protein [Peijinzhouia sedimentorum]
MSNNKIDQFFSKKLENHSATPSADAWSRLESKLDKKEKRVGMIWWQFAAAILLLLTIGGLFYNSMQSNDPANMVNETKLLAEEGETNNNNIVTEEEKVQEPEEVEEPENLIADNKPAVSEKTKATVTSTSSSNLIAQNEAKVTEKPIDISIAELEKVVAKSDLEDVETLGLVIPTEVVKPTKVIQVASFEVEIYRGLNKPEQTTAKTTEKKSTFKRALEIAMDVKNGEIALDDLRGLKDGFISNLDDDNKAERNRKVMN